MKNLNELKKWIELGYEPSPTTKSIINKINNLIQKQMENENNKKGEWQNDPENYEKMSEHFITSETLEESVDNFHQEIAALRKKYKMTEVIIISSNSVKEEDGVMNFMSIQQYGDGKKHPELIAAAFKKIKLEILNNLNKLAGSEG